MAQVDLLIENNRAYALAFEKKTGSKRNHNKRVTSLPERRLAIIACMDARIDILKLFGLDEGDAHIIRNAGGIVSEDVIRSLLISQRLLGTKEIILLHHTDCGMLRFTDDDMKDKIKVETGIRPPFALEAFGNLDEDVRQSIARIQASPFILEKGSLHGLVYDVQTGLVRRVE